MGSHACDRSDISQLRRSGEILDISWLERAMLTVEDQEVPALHGDELRKRWLRIGDEAAMDRATRLQDRFGFIDPHTASQSRLRLTTSSHDSDDHDRIMASMTEATASASPNPG